MDGVDRAMDGVALAGKQNQTTDLEKALIGMAVVGITIAVLRCFDRSAVGTCSAAGMLPSPP
jgi:hypothetical protein